MKHAGGLVASGKKFRLNAFPIFFVAILSLLVAGAFKTQKAPPLTTAILTEGLQFPWEILWGPDNHIWMTERGGRISRVNPSTGQVTVIHRIPDVNPRGEGGLLGMALHPDFQTSPLVYVVYNYSARNDYREKVVRYEFKQQQLVNPITIIDNIDAAGIHNGSRLLFSPDKKLFITTGDAANQSQPQLVNSLNGKILRLLPDGSIPADNPFPGNPVWSYGHRNPQGLVFVNNRLFSSEHGPSSDDEINIIEKGRNYGWPRVTGFCSNNDRKFCEANKIKEPVKAWTPTIAVCGLDYYQHDRIPGWKNSLLLATLRASKLIRLELADDRVSITSAETVIGDQFGRLRDICIAPDGKVYVCTGNGNNDKIIVIDK